MPDQPDIQQRIADIHAAHEWSPDEPYEGWGQCECDARWLKPSEHHTHVAEVLVSELGITREWALTGGAWQKVMSEAAAKDKAARWPESFGVASRFVTQWQDE